MPRLLTTVALLLPYFLSVHRTALASPCVAFDISWNLLAFGVGGKDWNAGTQDSWASGTAKDITTSGRPPFDGKGTTCFLVQFDNAIYVLNGDASAASNIHIYDASAKSWSTQKTTPATQSSFSASGLTAILDHDTNVFYALSNGELFSLEMGSPAKTASSKAIQWNDVGAFPKSGYDSPVMALAQNHIHFLNVPGVDAGSAQIFVIHFSFFQPTPQVYGQFPATHGQTASIFLDSGVQQEFVFVPDDASATYVINVETNSTQTLPGPPTKDSSAIYFGAPDSIVQMSSSGAVSFLPYSAKDASANKAASWSSVKAIVADSSSSSSSSDSSNSASASGKPTGSQGAAGSLATGASGDKGGSSNANGAVEVVRMSGMLMVTSAIVMGAVGVGSSLF